MLIGTTGLNAADHELIAKAAETIPVLQATNTSLGVNVLLSVAAQVARQLGDAYDIEIVEAHHNQKKDAPSGTALSLAESICKCTGRSLDNHLVHGREGPETLRKKGTIGMHAVRMGDVVGEHTIFYATPGERIEIRHVAEQSGHVCPRARSAPQHSSWHGSDPGRYTMARTCLAFEQTCKLETQTLTLSAMHVRKTVKLTSWPDPLVQERLEDMGFFFANPRPSHLDPFLRGQRSPGAQ